MFIDCIESIIYLTLTLPLIFLCINKQVEKKLVLTGLFCFYFLLMQFLLLLPINYNELDFIGGKWNWLGKIFAIIASLIFYHMTKHHFREHQYLTSKQSPKDWGKVRIAFVLIFAYAVLEGIIFYNRALNWETLLFQATMPGIEEEISYRAILFGLLSTLLVNEIKIFSWNLKYPSIWIIGILFGIIHALKLQQDYSLTFNTIHFLKTFILGTIWSWMTLKARSILLPMISHNLANFIPNLIGMLK